ncbi:1-pyrroline-5-carboxylate dehydrogenase, partial [Allomuricauda sp. XS_ASV26]
MGKGFFQVPTAVNEPVKTYVQDSPEREEVLEQYKAYYNGKVEVPLYIGNEEIKTGNTRPMSPPHDHRHIVGHYHLAEKEHVEKAIANCLESR